ncbi:AAA family ATPase [Halonatronum saccharophilum]|uniref:AAA family ATPase n=1 Tax=Halonatronum saccharophilum TaxID=150060 RepID=UPI000482DD3B|nr:AAA family ATPase [Halonatronum saccharophilum]
MKRIDLLKLELKNFKGVKNFTLDLQGANAQVFGNNATGKTTIFDAFNWLLFDKDSKGQSTFDIKTLDKDGQAIHNLEHQVEGTLSVNGKKLTLRKSYYEKWTKKRGSAKESFSGHTTDYFINDVPVKKKEYDARISEIVDENIFKLLTSPAYFNEQLHWQERREILLEVCGGITDENIIDQNDKLKKLADILEERSLEDHQKVIASRRKKINKELDKIPVRVDEVSQSLPEVDDLDKRKLMLKLSDKEEEKKMLQQSISRIESGGEVAKKTKELREIESELLDIKNKYRVGIDKELDKKQERLEEIRDKFRTVGTDIRIKNNEIKVNGLGVERLEKEIEKLKDQWYKVNQREFETEQEEVCPTCSQEIPHHQLEEARAKALAKFNGQKAEELEEINATGKAAKAEMQKLEEENKEISKEVDKLQKKADSYQEKAQKLKGEIEELKEKANQVKDDFDYRVKLKEKESLEKIISNLKGDKSEELEKVDKEIKTINNEISKFNSQLAKFDQYEKSQARIEELAKQEKELAAEYDKLEEQLYLCEEFIKTKVNLLEEKINSKFEYAHFKLFDEQINGGLKETCETLYEGVPYSSGLNNGAQINVGLDIINTLAEHYKFQAPIFIDNRESVTDLIGSKSQVISLVVSEADKALRVELEQSEIKEAV